MVVDGDLPIFVFPQPFPRLHAEGSEGEAVEENREDAVPAPQGEIYLLTRELRFALK